MKRKTCLKTNFFLYVDLDARGKKGGEFRLRECGTRWKSQKKNVAGGGRQGEAKKLSFAVVAISKCSRREGGKEVAAIYVAKKQSPATVNIAKPLNSLIEAFFFFFFPRLFLFFRLKFAWTC